MFSMRTRKSHAASGGGVPGFAGSIGPDHTARRRGPELFLRQGCGQEPEVVHEELRRVPGGVLYKDGVDPAARDAQPLDGDLVGLPLPVPGGGSSALRLTLMSQELSLQPRASASEKPQKTTSCPISLIILVK
jgi:hypothetical protein